MGSLNIICLKCRQKKEINPKRFLDTTVREVMREIGYVWLEISNKDDIFCLCDKCASEYYHPNYKDED